MRKSTFAGDMGLPHSRRQPRLPGAVEVAETTVAVAVGVRGTVLLPEQLQCHALPAQLAMDRPPVGLRPTGPLTPVHTLQRLIGIAQHE
jgi:hypothetical protein